MEDADWQTGFARSLMVYLNGRAIREPDHRGNEIVDDDIILAINADANEQSFSLPDKTYGTAWRDVLDTGTNLDNEKLYTAGESFQVDGRAMRVLIRDTSKDSIPTQAESEEESDSVSNFADPRPESHSWDEVQAAEAEASRTVREADDEKGTAPSRKGEDNTELK